MADSPSPVWRDDVDALAFRPDGHLGFCMVHRRAFRALLPEAPTPPRCTEFFLAHHQAFQAAAYAKVVRARVAAGVNFHLTSRDIRRQLQD